MLQNEVQQSSLALQTGKLLAASVASLVCLGPVRHNRSRRRENVLEQSEANPGCEPDMHLTMLLAGLLACASICCQYFLDSCTISSWVIPGKKKEQTGLSYPSSTNRREGGRVCRSSHTVA